MILDRSVFSDLVFAVKNRLDGNISVEGFEYYMRLRKKMLDVLPIPHVTVYLKVSPVTCWERVRQMRGRVSRRCACLA